MYKLYTLVLFLVGMSFNTNAQFNMNLLSQVSYDANLSDIWGWADPDTGVEYAIVGVNNGVSIVSLEDPENATELFFIPGQNSTWRDIKTWGNYAYVTTDQGGTTDGLLIIDMTDLPGDIEYYNWNPTFPALGNDVLNTCHNIYIDEFGYAYLSGCNLNGGGIIYLDLNDTPYFPEYAGAGPDTYSHDIYVRDNKSYSSEIYAGLLSVYDVSDKLNTQKLGDVETPFSFTHNAWLSDDGLSVYTTDELANAPVAAYDVSDPSDEIIFLDEYRPLETIGDDVIPHNVHVWNDFLIISYYTDGGRIVDAANPDNLIEVGNYDTFLGNGAGFQGAWGAYPFLPSGNVLITDIGNGLYVCGVDYIRACYLEGIVTDAVTTNPIFNVDVSINQTTELNEGSTATDGSYKTGLATAGSYSVTFSHPNYISQTIAIDLDNGVLTELDVQLEPKPSIQGIVVDVNTTTINDSHIQLTNSEGDITTYSSDQGGNFQIFADPGTYTAVVGAWGYRTIEENVIIEFGTPVQFVLEEGYEDDFIFDFGWNTGGNASTGDFERVVPEESTFMNQTTCLGEDLSDDFGNQCYVTGNGGDGGQNDIDNGNVILESPSMDLSSFVTATIDFSVYFWVGGGNGGPVNDTLYVKLSNNLQSEQVAVFGESLNGWTENTVNIHEYITLTNNVKVTFTAGDSDPGHIVEAMVDGIYVSGESEISNTTDIDNSLDVKIGPNPFADNINYTCNFDWNTNMSIELMDINGKVYAVGQLNQAGTIQIPNDIPSGNLIFLIKENDTILHKEELIRIN